MGRDMTFVAGGLKIVVDDLTRFKSMGHSSRVEGKAGRCRAADCIWQTQREVLSADSVAEHVKHVDAWLARIARARVSL